MFGINLVPKHLVIDGFLPQSLHDALLAWILTQEDVFRPSGVMVDGHSVVNTERRNSWQHQQGLGAFEHGVRAEVDRRYPELCAGVGVDPFSVADVEFGLVAHRNGSFYERHHDTFSGASHRPDRASRVVSLCYYLHAQPRRFTGGELAIYSFAPHEPPLLIAPEDNRLVAFPSIAQHEVRPIVCPPVFAAARFAINIWLSRSGEATPAAWSDRIAQDTDR